VQLNSLKIASIPDGMVLYNDGEKCDLLLGPCSCGAWHNITDIKRIYIFFLTDKGDL